jgi:hypothetical protein
MQRLAKIELVRTRHIPKQLEPGVLYVSEEYGAAVHLCACGCGTKVSTPLGPTEWTLQVTASGPSLMPSVGNWQLPCQSHYWIREGNVLWAAKWSAAQIEAGRRAEEERRRAHYAALDRKRAGLLRRFWRWINSLFE